MKLVSILSPCYNGETYVSRFLDSVLKQDYSNLEVIMVNDGSTDNTDNIIKSYIEKFKKKNINFIYLTQENSGAAGAINNGLKYVKGEYLTWPDSDDILTPDSISKKVKFLEDNPQYGFVKTDASIYDENDLNNSIGFLSKKAKSRFNEQLFEDFIYEKNGVYFAPGCYMVRMSAFLDVNPSRSIYITKGGQNWQMLLPISHKYKCGYIDESLYYYIVRKNSHSHASVGNFEKEIKKIDNYLDILINVLSEMNLSEKQKDDYIYNLKLRFSRKKIGLARQYKFKKVYFENFCYLKQQNKLPVRYKIFNYIVKINNHKYFVNEIN